MLKPPKQWVFLGVNEHFQTRQYQAHCKTYSPLAVQTFLIFSSAISSVEKLFFVYNHRIILCYTIISKLQCKILLTSLWFLIYSEKLITADRSCHLPTSKRADDPFVTGLILNTSVTSSKELSNIAEISSSNGKITWQQDFPPSFTVLLTKLCCTPDYSQDSKTAFLSARF